MDNKPQTVCVEMLLCRLPEKAFFYESILTVHSYKLIIWFLEDLVMHSFLREILFDIIILNRNLRAIKRSYFQNSNMSFVPNFSFHIAKILSFATFFHRKQLKEKFQWLSEQIFRVFKSPS